MRLKRDLDSAATRARRNRGFASRRRASRTEQVDRRSLLREPQRREGRRVPPRRHHRGHHHRAVEDQGLKIFSRPTVLAFRDKPVTPAQIGQQLGAAYVLDGSLRRAGNRLRINAQLVDTHTDFPLWSERYDREMKDVFEVQDEIARKIAEALRVTLSPQEQEALAAKPTENLQAYDLYLRGKSYARRLTRQDWSSRCRCSRTRWPSIRASRSPTPRSRTSAPCSTTTTSATGLGGTGARRLRRRRSLCAGICRSPGRQAWILYATELHDEAVRMVREGASSASATARAPTTCSAARCSLRAATRKSLEVAEPRSKRAATTTTFTCRS